MLKNNNLIHDGHDFAPCSKSNERRTLYVIIITAITMIGEIVFGWLTGSMALLADGWHMGTHASALGIALFAFIYARRNANNPRYTFGTGKVGILTAYSSAILLGASALYMIYESIVRFIHPVDIIFNQAILVAVIGLVVNFICVIILQEQGHHHHHEHERTHEHDHNLRAAYLHVIADALTSVLAIIALFAAKYFGWVFLDPVMGIVGGLLIGRWAVSLLKSTAKILLDCDIPQETVSKISDKLKQDKEVDILDLHVWRLGSNATAAIVSLSDKSIRPPSYFHEQLKNTPELKHLTVEVNGKQL
jgi:cation diffusion facilitator family transporter